MKKKIPNCKDEQNLKQLPLCSFICGHVRSQTDISSPNNLLNTFMKTKKADTTKTLGNKNPQL